MISQLSNSIEENKAKMGQTQLQEMLDKQLMLKEEQKAMIDLKNKMIISSYNHKT